MNDKDQFAVWIASKILRANDDGISASTLEAIARQSTSTKALDDSLADSVAQSRRPGDFGVEFVVALLPIVLVEFGRLLWEEYTKALAKQGGDALAKLTIDASKALARKTWSMDAATLTLAEAEAKLKQAAVKAGLDATQTDMVIKSLRNPEVSAALGKP
ncbi:MAG: hypothetical protein AB7O57_15065 [Hyphomicrobiaceae bacterium]